MNSVDPISFEEALKELETIVRRLEEGKTSLEDAISSYERGAALRVYCEKKLKDARLRVEQIVVNTDGTLTTKSVDPLDLPCMDNADIRRGKPSCHKCFGEATAILVGDALIPLAFQTLAALDVSSKLRLDLIDGLAQAIGSLGLVAGQMMDLGQEGFHHTLEALLEQQRLKTGVLFGFAAEAGAILGGASIEERQILKSYGLLFGKAFQMKDDWLDACGNEQIIGKPCHQDTNKFTFLNFLSPELLEKTVASTLQEAIETLSSFGKRGALLKEFAIFSLCEEKMD